MSTLALLMLRSTSEMARGPRRQFGTPAEGAHRPRRAPGGAGDPAVPGVRHQPEPLLRAAGRAPGARRGRPAAEAVAGQPPRPASARAVGRRDRRLCRWAPDPRRADDRLRPRPGARRRLPGGPRRRRERPPPGRARAPPGEAPPRSRASPPRRAASSPSGSCGRSGRSGRRRRSTLAPTSPPTSSSSTRSTSGTSRCVGKVWLLSAVDGASSFRIARVVPG
jgi:hypothetical protein